MMNIPIFDNTGNNEYKRFPRKPRGGAIVASNKGSQQFDPALKDVMEKIIDGKLDKGFNVTFDLSFFVFKLVRSNLNVSFFSARVR